ncbi:hypothetical protein [Hymenobacter convexus]|uniref:hypothetical protein n=1 Tax=Hymenobacter sp. CA1UV-4 TaxID=3063782 RepID=UPI002712EE92|nr:hypothetical protein [Hymenobacter sp. CA1UV-4]MDO7851378.1 hypothetical protein [Hymenobacter sp. CA1UV-4]
MNGYTLANHFRKLRPTSSFSSIEADLFYELVGLCNDRNWPTEFQYPNPLLCATLGISEKSLITARNRLKQAGLLEFTSGHKRSPTVYRFLDPDAEIPLPQVSINGSKSGSINGTHTGSRTGTPYKEQTKRKSKTPPPAPAVEASEEVSASVSLPDWQAWLDANAPEVQRLKTPFGPNQWANLVADFGEPLAREVALAMQNHAGLAKKYTSAYLTARDWCKRRQPAQPAAPRPAPQPVPAPVLDPEAVAANTARQQSAMQQRIAQRQQRQEALAA